MKIIDSEQFFKVFIFTNSYTLLRQFVSLNYSVTISSQYEEAMEYILQSHKRRQYDFILVDITHTDLLDCIRLLCFVQKDFPAIKRIIVINRNLSVDSEMLLKETFDADKVLNLNTTNDFYNFFKETFSAEKR